MPRFAPGTPRKQVEYVAKAATAVRGSEHHSVRFRDLARPSAGPGVNSADLLDGNTIRQLMIQVAEELDKSSTHHTLVIVGGSLLAWYGLRDSTADVDSIRLMDDELRAVALEVAARHGLAVDWLNDHATAFAPATLDIDGCEVLLDRRRLSVLGAPLRDVFLMKLRRSDPADLVRHAGNVAVRLQRVQLRDETLSRRSTARFRGSPTMSIPPPSSSPSSRKVVTTSHWAELFAQRPARVIARKVKVSRRAR